MLLNSLINKTQNFFLDLGFKKVITPLLNPALPLEQNIYSFEVINPNSKEKLYQPTSPEFALKKHLATHQKDCFSISKCYRNLEAVGPHHRPEFTMLEWYEVGKNYLNLMVSVKKYLDLFIKLDYIEFPLPPNLPDNEPDFNQYFLNQIEPKLPLGGVFITGYPAFLTPMALPGQRFELYIDRVEVANGNSESLDSKSVLQAFQKESLHRQKNHLPSHPIDMEFIQAIGRLPPCAGVGLGLDRLLMILNHSSILG